MSTLAEIIARSHPLVVPAVYDGITAHLAHRAGFEAAYIGSYGTGATLYGLPDIGFIDVQDMADQVRRLAPVAQVPLIVDAEAGWGNQIHIARSIRLLETAGAAAIHLEDHEFGKHLTLEPRVVSTSAACDKIKAAVDARDSRDFMIIARTDSLGIEGGESAIERLVAYAEVGADAVMLSGVMDMPLRRQLRDAVSVPIVVLDQQDVEPSDVADTADVMIYFALAHLAARKAVEEAFTLLAAGHGVESMSATRRTPGATTCSSTV